MDVGYVEGGKMKYIIMATIKSDTSENRIFKTTMLKLGFVPFRSDGRGDFEFVPKIIDEI